MKKLVFSLLILLIFFVSDLYASKEYWFSSNYLSIRNINVSNFPEISIEFKCIYRGSPADYWDENFLSKISVLDSFNQYQVVSYSKNVDTNINVNVLVHLKSIRTRKLLKLYKALEDLSVSELNYYDNRYNSLQLMDIKSILNQPIAYGLDRVFVRNFVRYVNNIIDRYPLNDYLHIFVGRFKDINNLDLFYYKLGEFNDYTSQWYGMFYVSKPPYFLEHGKHLNKCVFIDDMNIIDVYKIKNIINNTLSLLSNSNYVVNLVLNEELLKVNNKSLRLKVCIENDTLETNVDLVSYLNDIELIAYDKIVNRINELVNNNKYNDAINIYRNYFINNKYFEYDENIIHSIVSNWLNYLLSNMMYGKLEDVLNYVEKELNINADKKWYKSLKLNILRNMVNYYKKRNDYSNTINTYEKILKIEPSWKIRRNILIEEGKLSLKENKYIEASRHFRECYETYNDKNAIKLLNNTIKNGSDEYYSRHDYYKLFMLINSNIDYVRFNFKYKYYYAEGAYNIYRYDIAKNEYQWLLDNWRNNKIVKWEEVYKKLQISCLKTMDFDNAYVMLQQMIREENRRNNNIIKAIATLRIKYCIPALRAFVIADNNDIMINNIFKEISVRHWPINLIEICYYDKKYNRIYSKRNNRYNKEYIYDIKNITNSITVYPYIDVRSAIVIMIENTNNGYLVIVLNNDIDETEKEIVKEIYKDVMREEPWYELYKYEQKNWLSTLSRLLSNIIGNDYNYDGKINIDEYMNKINDNGLIEYIVMYNVDGKVVNETNDVEKYIEYENAKLWNRSKNTNAILYQVVKYKNKDILDYSNPFYYGGEYKGIIKIGFKKY